MGSRDRHGESAAMQDRRDAEADSRESAADRRERDEDIREGVLDRWERELTERAVALGMLDEVDGEGRELARRRRADAHRRRRADAEERHEAAIARGIERGGSEAVDEGDSARSLEAQSQGTLDRLAALVASSGSLAETLNTILAITMDAFADAAAVTVSLPIGGRLEPAASTASWAAELDAAQLRAQRGPIAEVVEAGTVVTSADLGADDRWALADLLGPNGRRGALSAAILVGGTTAGVLTVYSGPGTSFDRRSVVTAAILSAQASLALGWSLERLTHRAQVDAWERAVASRDQIGQAKGILMEQRDLSADAAFALLRVTSQHLNAKVRDIAEHVVTHRRLPDSPPTTGPPDRSAGS